MSKGGVPSIQLHAVHFFLDAQTDLAQKHAPAGVTVRRAQVIFASSDHFGALERVDFCDQAREVVELVLVRTLCQSVYCSTLFFTDRSREKLNEIHVK